MLELTEHVVFDDYAQVRTAVAGLRQQGVRFAVDDVGAGFSSFRHIVELEAGWIKLDRMAEALVTFAQETGTRVIAEGIETPAQLETVRQLDIPMAKVSSSLARALSTSFPPAMTTSPAPTLRRAGPTRPRSPRDLASVTRPTAPTP